MLLCTGEDEFKLSDDVTQNPLIVGASVFWFAQISYLWLGSSREANAFHIRSFAIRVHSSKQAGREKED
jgi:hypothetical protein